MDISIPNFIFSEAVQAGINTGKYVVMQSKDGTFRSVAVDRLTGKIIGLAKGITIDGRSLDPLAILPKLGQLSRGMAILQATNAVIGVGVAANIGISAVSLYQTLKLREDVKLMRSEMKDGFLDLKIVLRDQGQKIIEHIDQVAEDVKFHHHRTILSCAYAQFSQAIQCLQTALTIQDLARRDAEIQSARNMMADALKDYENPDLLQDINAAGYIRRRECVWAIRQAIAYSFQLQGEHATSQHNLETLEATIRQDSRQAVEIVNSEIELDFLFPEILHIYTHDLTALKVWKSQLTWLQELPEADVKQLSASGLSPIALPESTPGEVMEVPAAQIQYETFKTKSHYTALKDQLQLLVEPDRRLEYTTAINQAAQQQKLYALTIDNLNEASDFTIANLYNYLQPAVVATA